MWTWIWTGLVNSVRSSLRRSDRRNGPATGVDPHSRFPRRWCFRLNLSCWNWTCGLTPRRSLVQNRFGSDRDIRSSRTLSSVIRPDGLGRSFRSCRLLCCPLTNPLTEFLQALLFQLLQPTSMVRLEFSKLFLISFFSTLTKLFSNRRCLRNHRIGHTTNKLLRLD